MKSAEREFIVGQLVASEARLLDVMRGMTRAQVNFRTARERWSIVEVLEHLATWESFMLNAVRGALAKLPEPGKKITVIEKDPLVLALARSRDKPLKARDVAQPTGRWKDVGEVLAEFRSRRAKTVEFAEKTQEDLRSHFFPHIVFGELDCYQWLIAMGQHTLRHVAQIEEVMRDPGFPSYVEETARE